MTRVAMEATGVYWKPVWYLLEDDFELLLYNAGHVKNVPGRKTDVSDAQWYASCSSTRDPNPTLSALEPLRRR